MYLKDSARIETQRLHIRSKGFMAPRAPRNAIAGDSANAELFNGFREGHAKLARQEFDSATADVPRQAIPEVLT